MSYEDDLRADPVALAKRHSILTPNSASDFNRVADVNAVALTGDFQEFKRSHVKREKKIARATLRVIPTNRGECLEMKVKIGDTQGVPVYYLPYDGTGAAVRMTIPDKDPALPEEQHPKLFFTAVLSGCSIIFKGTAQNPTIYHCGTEGKTGGAPETPSNNPSYDDSNDFFAKMLRGPGYRNIEAQIKSYDYMIPRDERHAGAIKDLKQQFLESIQAQPHFKRGVTIKYYEVWGTCFGVRNGRDWTFYHQENGSIQYDTYKWDTVTREKQAEKKTLFGTKTVNQSYITTGKVMLSTNRLVARPIQILEVFPGLGSAALRTPHWELLQL